MQQSLIVLIVFVIICFIETLLSQNENKYIGLVIPTLSFVISIVLSVAYSIGSFNILKTLFTFVLLNIPTLIFMLLYRHAKKHLK